MDFEARTRGFIAVMRKMSRELVKGARGAAKRAPIVFGMISVMTRIARVRKPAKMASPVFP